MTPPEMRAWIASRLDPIDAYDPLRVGPRFEIDLRPNPRDGDLDFHPAAVLMALVEHPDGLTVLLTRRADALRKHSGQIAFPGGRQDLGETPWDAALREAQEEIGLDPAHVALAGLLSPYRTGTGFEITPVVGFIAPGLTLTPNPAEVADIFETPFVFLMNPDNHERRFHDLANGLRRQFYAMSYEDRLIWGITAGMLRGLYDRLYGSASAHQL